jgi:hypothetical protein
MAEIDPRAYEIPSLVNLLQTHNDGDDLARADAPYHQVMAAATENIGEHGGSAAGEIILKVKITADAKGVDVTIESDAKVPRPPRMKMRYFANDRGDGLTLRNPNRDTMFPATDLGRRRRSDVS